jgi:penicillin-binding protein A
MASTPTYDPNQLSSHDPQAIRDYWEQLNQEKNDPRLNRAISDNYPPGSVFKVIVSAAALSSGYTPDTKIPAPNLLTLPNTRTTLENFNGSTCNGGADQRLIDALTISCNTAFAELGMKLGEDKVRSMAEAFGMDDKKMQIPLDVAPSGVGDIESQAALGQTSIGQRDVRMTPLQAAMVAATVANKGSLMKPYLVDQVRAPDLSVIGQTDPEEFRHPISADVATQLTAMMTSVVQKGTGRAASIDGVQVAGKTGTAQVSEGVPDHTWFIGFAPANDPQIAVAVFVANGGGTGGERSAPIARQVMEAYLNGRGG